MATDNYLMSAQSLKDFSPVHGNVDEDMINLSILTCQDMFIERIIGTELIEDLYASIGSFTANETTLVEKYIQPAITYWVMSDIVDTISYRLTNSGMVQSTGENIVPASDESLRRQSNKYMNKAKGYARRLYKYLCENDDLFPLFDADNSDYDEQSPSTPTYNTGIFLGGVRGKRFTSLYINETAEKYRGN